MTIPTLYPARTALKNCLGTTALSLFLFLASATQASAASYHPMHFDQLTLEDGLSQSNVLAIWQDSDGFMWFGTQNGLNRYDGYSFKALKRERGDARTLANDFIYAVTEDKAGQLWVATNGGGVARVDRSTGTVTNFTWDSTTEQNNNNNVVRALVANDDGTLWLGTRGAGLRLFDPASGTAQRVSLGDERGEVFALLRDDDSRLWVGTNEGLFHYDPKTGEATAYRHDANNATSLAGQKVRAILRDSQRQLWVGTYGGGLSVLDEATKTFKRYTHDRNDVTSLANNRVTSLLEDRAKRLWVGTSGGLSLFDRDSGNFVRFAHNDADPRSLADNAVTALFEDRTGLLWVGTRSRGVSKWNPRTWAFGFDDASELVGANAGQPNVTSFTEGLDATLWIGTFGKGLAALNRDSGSVTRYLNEPGDSSTISGDRVMSLLRDRAGNVWVGTMTGGLNRLDPKTGVVTRYSHNPDDENSLSANGVMAIFENVDGMIWAGTYGGGISVLNPATGEVTRLLPDGTNPNALSSSSVTAFAPGANGLVWVGTDAGGLNLYDPATRSFTQFRHDPEDPASLAADTIYALSVDKNGSLWIGTQGGGIDRLVGSASAPGTVRFVNISQSDGLANDVIYGLQIDKAGQLWASSNLGISRIDPETGDIKNMHRRHGLQSEEFNFGAHYQSDSGELFFGGHNGFNAFFPENVKASNEVPLIKLTGFFDSNGPIEADIPLDSSESDGIQISYQDDTVSFEFAALDFAAPLENSYRYKLVGFDKDWIDLGNRRRVTYTDLNDGQYVLRVQAANSDGVWNESGLSIPVRVTPAPWDTWWAYLGYIAVSIQFFALLWLAHRRKVRREEEYSHRLEQEVQLRTEKLVETNEKLRTLNSSLQESSLSDPLTGLRNRRFVFEEVPRDLRVTKRRLGNERDGLRTSEVADFVFMMIDLDNFKPINDTYGHAAGDQVLLEVRDVLLSACRSSDIVVRWGGDEFVVIARQAKPGEAEALAERIRAAISDHNFVLSDGQIVRTTCSIGFAAYPLFRGRVDESGLDQILSVADSLMYEAKCKRNAWAGMLTSTDAATSFAVDSETIDSSSMLFRASRAGKLVVFTDDHVNEIAAKPIALSNAG